MSSIIVLDSSDEEGGSAKKKPRLVAKANQQTSAVPSMARVNPIKANATAGKKTQGAALLPNETYKIHLPTKRAIPNEVIDQIPEKRARRIKPTTVVNSNDEEWIKSKNNATPQWNGERPKGTPPGQTMLSKNVISSVKNPIRVVKSPTTTANTPRMQNNTVRNVASPNQMNKGPGNFVRVAWNAKDAKPSSPPVINKNITTALKEQPKSGLSPPIINKSITATVKDPNTLSSLPVFNKNSVTIRKVVVNEDGSKQEVTTKNTINTKIDPPKTQMTNATAPVIRRGPAPKAADPLKITMSTNKNLNNPGMKVTQVHAALPTLPANAGTSIRRIQPGNDSAKVYQNTNVLKRNDKNVKLAQDPIAVVSTSPTMLYTSPATIKKIVNVDIPKTPVSSTPVITKVVGSGVPKKTPTEQPKLSMSMSVITKNHSNSVKNAEPKMSPPTQPRLPAIMNRPSGLIVTPITCTAVTTPTVSPVYSKTSNSTPNPTRSTAKQSKAAQNRARSGTTAAEQALASMTMMSMFPPGGGGFMGNPQMMYDLGASGGAFINPAYLANRQTRPMEGPSFPTMNSPVFNVNYPSFSGGSITPVISPGPAASPTYTSGRSSKSPVTSTVTRSSSATRSPAGFMGMTIDVDQPINPPMSPPVFNMNHVPFNGDPFNFMRNAHNIPSPSFSPVRSTKSPNTGIKSSLMKAVSESLQPQASPIPYKSLDTLIRSPHNYPQAESNGPIISLDSPPKSHSSASSPTPIGLFKNTPTINLTTSPSQSAVSDGSSITEVLPNQQTSNGKEKSQNVTSDDKNDKNEKNETPNKKKDGENDEDVEEVQDEPEKEPLNPEFETLLKTCREADSSEDMNRLIETKLVRYYYSVHPDFVKSRGFRKAVIAATDSIKKNAELVYYHLRPVVEELKARKKCKAIVMTNDEMSAAAEAEQEGIEDKVRNRQIRRLNKGLYILTRKIHKLENDEVDLDDENSTYLIVERYKKRACEIYDKICDLTGESKHALRQVKKPITFKETDYPKFNKVVETFVNRTKEFPDFFDVLRMLEFCNDRYLFGLVKEEMTMIAQDAFIKIGKLLQSRRKADLYETVSHFTSDIEDPADNDPVLLAKLSENEKNQTSIGSVIDKYAKEQVRRKAESANASDDEANDSSESSSDSVEEIPVEEKLETSTNNNKIDKKAKKKLITEEKGDESANNSPPTTTNGTHTPPAAAVVQPPTPPPIPSTSAAFRTSPPHAFESPEASPRPQSTSPLLPPCTTSSLKILSVTSLNESATSPTKNTDIVKPAVVGASVDEIVISDEDL